MLCCWVLDFDLFWKFFKYWYFWGLFLEHNEVMGKFDPCFSALLGVSKQRLVWINLAANEALPRIGFCSISCVLLLCLGSFYLSFGLETLQAVRWCNFVIQLIRFPFSGVTVLHCIFFNTWKALFYTFCVYF